MLLGNDCDDADPAIFPGAPDEVGDGVDQDCDGVDLVDWVLSAYESDHNIPYGAVIVFGPFMAAAARESFKERASKFRNIRTLTFTNNLGALMQRAAGVVAMGGYNTFCEILSFDKKAIKRVIATRKKRREEHLEEEAVYETYAQSLGMI